MDRIQSVTTQRRKLGNNDNEIRMISLLDLTKKRQEKKKFVVFCEAAVSDDVQVHVLIWMKVLKLKS